MSLAIVTGARGWLGTRLTQTLIQGVPDVGALGPSDRPVRCLVLPGDDPGELDTIASSVSVVRGDVTNPESLAPLFADARGATVFHCAGVIHPARGTKEFFSVNVEGTRNVVNAAVKAGVRRLVHVSSNSPLGTNPSAEHVFDESAPYRPYMTYGKTKMLAEELVNEAGAKGQLEISIIRPPWFYGPWQPPRQTVFFTMIRNGKGPLVGDGKNRRSMAYVDNICQGALLCEKSERAKGQTYWIADRRPYPMLEILDTVADVLQKDFGLACRGGYLRLPSFAADVARLVDATLQSVGLYHQKIHVLSEMNQTIACSIARAEAELGYDPKVDLREGMRRSIQWLIERGVTP